jgi:hypothetical protein
MRPRKLYPSVAAAHAEALFASRLQPSDAADPCRVQRVVAEAVRRLGRTGCAERVAQEFGDHPETAVARMRWARSLVAEAFGPSGPARASGSAGSAVRPVPAHAGRAA